MRNGMIVFGLFLCLACSKEPAPTNTTEILWDTWGVPHIFASRR